MRQGIGYLAAPWRWSTYAAHYRNFSVVGISVPGCFPWWRSPACSTPAVGPFSAVNDYSEQQKQLSLLPPPKKIFVVILCWQLAVPEKFFQQKERRTHSLRQAVRQITLKRWMMWIPRRETKIEHRIIQQGRGSYICHFHSEVDSYLSSWVNKTDRFEFNFLFMLEVCVFLSEPFYYQLLFFWKWYIRADTSTALTILCD